MPSYDSLNGRRLKISILVVGLVLRFVWIAMRGLSRDELTSFGFVFEPGWESAAWDNSPPTFYLAMKALWSVTGNAWVMRLTAFAVSATSFWLMFRHLDREERNFWLLGFWALSPTSVVNATFRPTILAELAGILFFLALRSGSTAKLLGSVVALVSSTFVFFVAPLAALAEIDRRDRKSIVVSCLAILVGLVAATRIDWRALSWLGTRDVWELAESGLLTLSQLWGFSLPLFLVVAGVLIYHRQVPRSFLLITMIMIVGPLVTGHRFLSSRFFIVLTPWVLFSIGRVLRLRREPAVGFLFILIPAVTTFWFLKHEKSGWPEAGQFVAATREPALFYAPSSLARLFSPTFKSGELDMDASISRHLPEGGWVLRANPARDVRMNEFLKTDGNEDFVPVATKVFGEGSLEPVWAVKVSPRARD